MPKIRKGFLTETTLYGMNIELSVSAEQVKKWAVTVLNDEVDIRDCINSLEVKLVEMKRLAESIKENYEEKDITPDDIYPNRARGTNIAGD